VCSAKRRHQSSKWTILGHVDCFIQGEVIGFQVLLDSLHPRSKTEPLQGWQIIVTLHLDSCWLQVTDSIKCSWHSVTTVRSSDNITLPWTHVNINVVPKCSNLSPANALVQRCTHHTSQHRNVMNIYLALHWIISGYTEQQTFMKEIMKNTGLSGTNTGTPPATFTIGS